MKENNYDVIVIGAGNGGLMAAANAAKKGLKTLILEKHVTPGGCATSFKRGRFEFEASLHEMAQIGTESHPGVARSYFSDLDLDIKWVNENHTFRTIVDSPEVKYDVLLPCGIEEFSREIDKNVPGSYDSVIKFFEYIKKAQETSRALSEKKIKISDLSDILNALRLASNSTDKFMDLLNIPKNAQYLLTTYWPYIGESSDLINAFTLPLIDYLYVTEGAGLPFDFSYSLSVGLDSAVRKFGGEIWYNSPVSKILVKDNAVYGVEVNGKTLYSNHIISNCFPETVFGSLIDKKNVPDFEKRKSNARTVGLSFFAVYLGLNKSAEDLGIKDYTTFISNYADSKSQKESCYGLGDEGLLIANCLNVVVPDCSPAGTCHFSITSPVFGEEWAKVSPDNYKKQKNIVAKKLIERCEKAMNISIFPYIEEIEIATPLTFARYLNSPNGSPYGYNFTDWDGMFTRTMASEKELTIKGLRFCGSHCDKGLGFNVTYESGISAAEKTYKDILKAKSKGGNNE